MNGFKLEFFGDSPQLHATSFVHDLIQRELICVRGKTGGAFIDAGSFLWSRAVKALSVLMVRSIHVLSNTVMPTEKLPVLSGCRSSLASSLDYAISKQPIWLLDMFGVDRIGKSLVQRMFRRSNPECKRPGPVSVALNDKFLPLENISIHWEGIEIKTPAEIEQLLSRLEVSCIEQK